MTDQATLAGARPSDASAVAAVRAWTSSIARKAGDVVKASALPFRLRGGNATSCEGATYETAAALQTAASCLIKDRTARGLLSGTDLEVAAHATIPDRPMFANPKDADWSTLLPEAERASHTFVTLTTSDPKYPSDVLYGLFSVRSVGNAAQVDGAFLVFSSQGD